MQTGVGAVAATGVALMSAGVVAITPVAPPLPERVQAAVQLTADADWSVILDKAGQGAAGLASSYFDAPLPVLQQIVANQISYLGQLPDVAGIAQQIAANIGNGLGAPFAPTTDSLDAQHEFLYNALPLIQQIPLVDLLFKISPTGQALLDFATTYVSGAVLGLVGPLVGPVFVLGANLQSMIDDITAATPDPARALTTLLNTPAQMVDAFLNGGVHVDLTAVAEALGPSIGVEFPEGTKVGIAFGGLLSPGGSIFNALDLSYERDILGLPLIRVNLATGQGPGLIGSLIELNKTIAKAIGWDGSGSPLAPSEGSSDRSGLAPVDEVPRSVLASPVAALPGIGSGATDQKRGDAAIEATPVAAPTVEAVPATEIAGSAEDVPEELSATPAEGGKHRAEPGQSFGDQFSSAVAGFSKAFSTGSGKHAKASDDDDRTETPDADKPAKPAEADKPAKADKADKAEKSEKTAQSDNGGSDSE
ncbi:hypothetical protein BH11ACT6_BH11ACT6_23720 [soil metagenome]